MTETKGGDNQAVAHIGGEAMKDPKEPRQASDDERKRLLAAVDEIAPGRVIVDRNTFMRGWIREDPTGKK